jgi:hypothetical protein
VLEKSALKDVVKTYTQDADLLGGPVGTHLSVYQAADMMRDVVGREFLRCTCCRRGQIPNHLSVQAAGGELVVADSQFFVEGLPQIRPC